MRDEFAAVPPRLGGGLPAGRSGRFESLRWVATVGGGRDSPPQCLTRHARSGHHHTLIRNSVGFVAVFVLFVALNRCARRTGLRLHGAFLGCLVNRALCFLLRQPRLACAPRRRAACGTQCCVRNAFVPSAEGVARFGLIGVACHVGSPPFAFLLPTLCYPPHTFKEPTACAAHPRPCRGAIRGFFSVSPVAVAD